MRLAAFPHRRAPAAAWTATLAVTLGFAWWAPSALANNGLQFISYGVKAAGRGGAETAVADSALAAARNPAILMELDRVRFDGSLLWFYERTRARDDFDDELSEDGVAFPLPAAGVSWDPFAPDLGTEAWDAYTGGDVRFGFGMHMPAALVFAPTASVAFRPRPDLSVGISLSILVTYLQFDSDTGGIGGSGGEDDFSPEGDVDVFYEADGTPVVPPRPFDAGTGEQVTWAEVWDAVNGGVVGPPPAGAEPGPEPQILLEIRGAFGVGLGAQAGVLWTPHEDVAIGLGLRSPGIVFNPKGEGTLGFDDAIETLNEDPTVNLLLGGLIDTYVPDAGANGFESDYDVETDKLVVPPEVSLGVAWWPHDRWMITADARWIGWDMALNTLTLEATNGENADINEIAGGEDIEYDLDLLWEDQFVLAVGTSVGVTDWLSLRAGYNYGNNPVPQETMSASSLVIEHHLTLGASVYTGDWDFDLAYVWGLPQEETIDESRVRFKTELHLLVLGFGCQW